ncbi:cell envelope integrity protein CreD [Altericista sp. CCNU0014]|uniref:cell envelope integrity protein CreD n=1 Tax=Altericista sp. CCNU0014 TaxID=3082949 RepID=UPI00384B1855
MEALLKIFEQIKNSQFVRILLVSFLILMLQIPTAMMQGLVGDRQNLRQEAISSITTKWGAQQKIIGPQLVVPYTRQVQSGNSRRSEVKLGIFLPQTLDVSGVMDSETRYRGIFEVPVYKTDVTLRGRFQRPDLSNWGVRPEDILWDRAELNLQISDAHAIQNQAKLTWNQQQIAFAPGQGKGGSNPGIHASLKNQMTGNTFQFEVPLKLNGSERLSFAPFGEVTQVSLKSNWRDPSFQGLWLPNRRSVTDKGFEATWNIPSLGRNYAQQWNQDNPVRPETIQASVFGVDLISPVDNYRMASRSIQYNFLFLVLTFATFWLFEVIVQLRVHPLQYLLVGVAMSLFYLLQLALSEHLGFNIAYLIASAAVVVTISAYSVAVLRAKQRASTIGAMQVALYSYLYVVLANQDYSLLIGSIGLFGFLAVVMYLTRRVDWFNVNRSGTPPTLP